MKTEVVAQEEWTLPRRAQNEWDPVFDQIRAGAILRVEGAAAGNIYSAAHYHGVRVSVKKIGPGTYLVRQRIA